MLARRVSSCVEARTLASRERYGHLVLLSSVSAWPFQQGASQSCAGRISRLKILKHLQLLRPIYADRKKTDSIQNGHDGADSQPILLHCTNARNTDDCNVRTCGSHGHALTFMALVVGNTGTCVYLVDGYFGQCFFWAQAGHER